MTMKLQQWAANGWLRSHKTSKQEIADLFSIESSETSSTLKLASLRTGVLVLPIMLPQTLYHSTLCFRLSSEKLLQHYRTIQSLPVILVMIEKKTRTI